MSKDTASGYSEEIMTIEKEQIKKASQNLNPPKKKKYPPSPHPTKIKKKKEKDKEKEEKEEKEDDLDKYLKHIDPLLFDREMPTYHNKDSNITQYEPSPTRSTLPRQNSILKRKKKGANNNENTEKKDNKYKVPAPPRKSISFSDQKGDPLAKVIEVSNTHYSRNSGPSCCIII